MSTGGIEVKEEKREPAVGWVVKKWGHIWGIAGGRWGLMRQRGSERRTKTK
jgi:hypothetical protein